MFSRAEAWLDLIRSARFEESEAREMIGGKMIRWSRGQLPASLRFLGERWSWSKNKVDDFLAVLENEGMIQKNVHEAQTIITLVNYDVYNQKKIRKGQERGQAKALQRLALTTESNELGDTKADKARPKGRQRKDKTNKENKNTNKEEDILPEIHTSEQQELFGKFQEWVTKNANNVARMQEPFTIAEYVKMREKLSKERVRELLMRMHNWKPLLQKNTSAYLTLMNWSRRDYNSSEKIISNIATNNNVNEKLKAAGKRRTNGNGFEEDSRWENSSTSKGS